MLDFQLEPINAKIYAKDGADEREEKEEFGDIKAHYLAFDNSINNSVYGQITFTLSRGHLFAKETSAKILSASRYQRLAVSGDGT